MTVPLPVVTPVQHPATGASSKCIGLGAVITNVSLQALFDPAVHTAHEARAHSVFKAIEKALYEYKVVVVKNQLDLQPDEQFSFVNAFDPEAPAEHGHNDATVSHKGQKSLLYGIGNSIGSCPEVKLVGGGKQSERLGGKVLKQADHVVYHKHPLTSEEREQGFTRWHRWHMDASLFKTSLPLVTSLLCLATPSIDPMSKTRRPPLTVRWDDGSGLEMKVAAGSTGFVEGSKMLEGLDEETRKWAEGTMVEYAPWPYQWNGPTRGNSNGLGTVDEPNNTMSLEDLPPYKPEEIKNYPMVWTCPKTGRKGVQVHPVAVLALHPSDGTPSITDLSAVRSKLQSIQRHALIPDNIWAPAYEVGDLVLFNNRAVYHSATDYPESWGTRTMLQAHVAASFDPQ
ncbi:hypothetical protein JCM11641_005377 [Rhodosporidiobolus odoratus]